ncbi:MAG TPA: NAD(P)-binding domain-containing protein [Xanthobacteraceae bacterium]|nr:NAD(P)-binding domain-containing protein [Xanthobacteraceae bacterium]
MSYLVIGAGPAGLAALRSFRDAGLAVEGAERNADVGGQWLYGAPSSAVYASTHLISSKATTAFADFPMPADWPAYPGRAQIEQYFKDYAKHFALYPLIRFNDGVARLEPSGSKWRATFDRGETRDYDGVVIANGHLSDPLMPKISGNFSGTLLHAKEYKSPEIFEGKRVLISGMGNTGCDIVVDAIHRAKSVLWSVRGGNHFVPKFIAGKPADERNHATKIVLPKQLRSMLHEPVARFLVGPPERFGLPKPSHRLYDRTPIVNSLVLQHLGQGDVSLRRPVQAFDGNAVIFEDGKRDEIDIAVFATGYQITFPFLDDLAPLNWQPQFGAPRLYMNVFPPEENGLFVAGLLEGAGVGWPGRALQTDLIAAYLKAKKEKPAAAQEFRSEIARYANTPAGKERGEHGIFVDFLQYKRDLKQAIARLR